MANQIIVQALANNPDIRILCVPNMVNFTQTLLHFPCYAFVVGHECWHQMTELDVWSAEIVRESFPLPQFIEDHFAKRQRTTDSSVPMDIDEQTHVKKRNESVDSKHIVRDSDVKHLHLKRDGCNARQQRSFVPKNGMNLKPIGLEIESLNQIKSDFVSLETYDNEASAFDFGSRAKGFKKMAKRPLALYRELTINKIQNNPNKVKKPKDKMKNEPK